MNYEEKRREGKVATGLMWVLHAISRVEALKAYHNFGQGASTNTSLHISRHRSLVEGISQFRSGAYQLPHNSSKYRRAPISQLSPSINLLPSFHQSASLLPSIRFPPSINLLPSFHRSYLFTFHVAYQHAGMPMV